MAGVQLPIIPLRRQMFTTSPLKEISADLPFVIDFSKSLYFQREGEGLLVGMSNQVDDSMLDLKRFEERRLIQEYNVV
jgi:sarcosine oxidase subunit beta